MDPINELQKQLLSKAQSQIPSLVVRWNNEHGVASLMEGSLLPWRQVREAENLVRVALQQYGELLGPPDMQAHNQVVEGKLETKGSHYRARAYQIHNQLPIYGATLLVFADNERGVYRIQSSFWREVEVTAKTNLDEKALQRLLTERLHQEKNAVAFEEAWKRQKPSPWAQEHFPLTTNPTLYLYRMKEGFHPVYLALAYQPFEWQGVDGKYRRGINQVHLIFDASNGDTIWMEPTREGMAYTDQNGDGLSTLQDSTNNYLTRNLHIVQKDNADFYLFNRLLTPEIRTYDANGTETGLVNKLKGDTDLSKDADGHWNTTTTSCTANTRRDAQQPEVDGHSNAEEAWNFYHSLGWDGFDNGAYGTACPVRVTAHIGMGANAYFDKYAEPVPGTNTNKYYGYIAFYDGQCDGTTLKFDFMAGDPLIFGHEYQHAITFFGAAKSNGEPGYLYWNMWCGAIREGYSDSLACLRRGRWINPLFFPDGAIHAPASGSGAYQITLASGATLTVYPLPFRRIEFPRSPNTFDGSSYCDHYDDRDNNKDKYFHSTLLSHLAYLVGQGGVHQRASRGNAEFIPVQGVGLQRTAEIFLYALTEYYDTLPTNLAEETLIEVASYLLDAAKNVPNSGDRGCEYVMMRRALYALGLYPYDNSYNKTTYGGEACMMPWAYSWRFSQPYIGLPPLWWQSPDLFINENGTVEYNAVVGQENHVYARVRNIGDQALQNIKVRFYFAPAGTNLPASIAGWHPCRNQAGADCELNIASLAASSMNITNVNNPPGSQAVLWYLDPAYVTPQVDHFCLRAVIECEASNNNNDCPNEVQSNVSYEQPSEGATLDLNFQVANWAEKAHPLDLRVTHTLPKGYRVTPVEPKQIDRIILRPGHALGIKFKVTPPRSKAIMLLPPFDGKVTAKLVGKLKGRFSGELSDVRRERTLQSKLRQKKNIALSGQLAGSLEISDGKASFNGEFKGELNPATGALMGEARGNLALSNGRVLSGMEFRLEGVLLPLRMVNFTQYIDGEAVGGVTLKVRLPRLRRQLDPLE